MNNSELNEVSGGRIQLTSDGKWRIYPFSKKFSTEKEAKEYLDSIAIARAAGNHELERKLLDDLDFEEITPRLSEVSGGKGRVSKKTFVETKDGKWVICHAGIEFDTKQEAFNFLYEEINGPDEPLKKK